MKIQLDVNRVLSVYNNNSKTESSKKSNKSSGDKIDISSEGREISKYVELAKNSELVDKKVDSIKKQISNNQYNVDSSTLAKSIIENIKGSEK